MDKLYTTKNICESVKTKINYYLLKIKANNIVFINTISKIYINSKYEKKILEDMIM